MALSSTFTSLKTRWLAPLAVLAILPAAAACDADETADGNKPSPSPTAKATTPSAQPTVNPRDASTWTSGPGFIGPLKVGSTAQSLRNLGTVEPSMAKVCDLRWQSATWLQNDHVSMEFRDGDPNALDTVVAGNFHGASNYTLKTAEGIGIGSTTEDLKAAYSDLRYVKWNNEGGYYIGWVRDTPEGSIMFNVGGSVTDGGAVSGDGSHVTLIAVGASPLEGILSGC